MKFKVIHDHREEFELSAMCRILKVSRSGYHAWVKRRENPAPATRRREMLIGQIRIIYEDSGGTYGSPRIYRELIEKQIFCCVKTVARLMKISGIRADLPRRFVPRTTDSNHEHPVFENKLNREFTATLLNQKWLCDITYIHTDEGWLYLSAVLDVCSRKIVGWAMGEKIDTQLCSSALKMAIQTRKPQAGLLHHSDRGSQFASIEYQKQLDLMGIECSMSRVGNCWDNAMMESFWGSLKTEHVYRRKYKTRQEARVSIFLWIEGWYNRRRRHSALGYVSPEEFEASLN